jgi:hypothetical protein
VPVRQEVPTHPENSVDLHLRFRKLNLHKVLQRIWQVLVTISWDISLRAGGIRWHDPGTAFETQAGARRDTNGTLLVRRRQRYLYRAGEVCRQVAHVLQPNLLQHPFRHHRQLRRGARSFAFAR